ncbi:hypothetical protein CASFOL_028054 [Castilleja foliolosa]|uniref:Uncharacterized protein n=1 Tax=Castilleja foliolosa TaxID=1961234 RepID=A0ABD3CEM1_9LAMI
MADTTTAHTHAHIVRPSTLTAERNGLILTPARERERVREIYSGELRFSVTFMEATADSRIDFPGFDEATRGQVCDWDYVDM